MSAIAFRVLEADRRYADKADDGSIARFSSPWITASSLIGVWAAMTPSTSTTTLRSQLRNGD
jgi:hypothetical protein